MIDKLRKHIDILFEKAPYTKQTVEIKEEILQNTIDRYIDLITEGKQPEAAYNIAIAGIGNVDELIAQLSADETPLSMQYIYSRRRSALLLAVAVMMYILSIVPPIVFQDDIIGPALMFVFIAVATGLIVYRGMTLFKPKKGGETVVESFKEWNTKTEQDNSLLKAIQSIVWAVILVLYFALSFLTGGWYITWLMFFIGAAASNIVKACFDLKDGR